jgi:hypothetical protein
VLLQRDDDGYTAVVALSAVETSDSHSGVRVQAVLPLPSFLAVYMVYLCMTAVVRMQAVAVEAKAAGVAEMELPLTGVVVAVAALIPGAGRIFAAAAAGVAVLPYYFPLLNIP